MRQAFSENSLHSHPTKKPRPGEVGLGIGGDSIRGPRAKRNRRRIAHQHRGGQLQPLRRSMSSPQIAPESGRASGKACKPASKRVGAELHGRSQPCFQHGLRRTLHESMASADASARMIHGASIGTVICLTVLHCKHEVVMKPLETSAREPADRRFWKCVIWIGTAVVTAGWLWEIGADVSSGRGSLGEILLHRSYAVVFFGSWGVAWLARFIWRKSVTQHEPKDVA